MPSAPAGLAGFGLASGGDIGHDRDRERAVGDGRRSTATARRAAPESARARRRSGAISRRPATHRRRRRHPRAASSTPSPRPRTSGIPSARATIAAWPVGRTAREGDPADELGAERRDGRWIEVRATRIAGWPSACHRSGAASPRSDRRDAAADVAQVCGALTEVLVVDGRRAARPARRVASRIASSAATPGSTSGERRLDDPRVAREQRLGLEDRADVLPGPRRRLRRERLELGRRDTRAPSEPLAAHPRPACSAGDGRLPRRRRLSGGAGPAASRPDADAW